MEELTILKSLSSVASIVQGFCAVGIAIFAYRGLDSWKKQKRTDKHLDFLDTYIDAVNTFALEMFTPIAKTELIYMGIARCATSHDEVGMHLGTINFISQEGPSSGSQIKSELDRILPMVIKIESLKAKAKAMDLLKYEQCRDKTNQLLSAYEKLQHVASALTLDLKLEDPALKQAVDYVLSTSHKELKEELETSHSGLICELSKNYTSALS
jgi:hypothetical protein